MSYAYCTLVMWGDSYVAGALALGESLRQHRKQDEKSEKSPIPLYVCVTEDVSERARTLLKHVFDAVLDVPYIAHRCIPQQHSHFQKNCEWIEASFTKWNVLNPSIYPEGVPTPTKILLLDADCLVLKNVDHLFEWDTPGVCFSSAWSERIRLYGIKDYFPSTLRPGDLISHECLSKANNYGDELGPRQHHESYSCSSTTVLLFPNHTHFKQIVSLLNIPSPYGHRGVVSRFDEQLLCDWILKYKIPVRHLSPGYLWNAGAVHWIPKDTRIF